MDTILVLRLHHKFNWPLQDVQMNIKAAFNSINHQAQWQATRNIEAQQFLLHPIKDLKEGTNVRTCMNGAFSEAFATTTTGIQQGNTIVPDLFCRARDWIIEKMSNHHRIQLLEHRFSDLDNADVTLLDTSTTNPSLG